MSIKTDEDAARDRMRGLCQRLEESGFVNNIPGQFLRGTDRVRFNYRMGEWTITIRRDVTDTRFRLPTSQHELPTDFVAAFNDLVMT